MFLSFPCVNLQFLSLYFSTCSLACVQAMHLMQVMRVTRVYDVCSVTLRNAMQCAHVTSSSTILAAALLSRACRLQLSQTIALQTRALHL